MRPAAVTPETPGTSLPATPVSTVTATPAELSGLRARVVEFTRDNDGSDDAVDDLELIVSELATNVIRHTSDDAITLTLRVDRIDGTDEIDSVSRAGDESVPTSSQTHRWTLQMTGAHAIPDIDQVEAPPVHQASGRGLLIVRAVADAVEFDRASGTVQCTLDG